MATRHGYDLGTTKSVIATFDNGLRALANKEGDVITPSVVSYYLGEWYVGQVAKDIAEDAPENTVYSVKRFIGRNYKDPKVQEAMKHLGYKVKPVSESGEGILIEIDGQDYEPQAISAMVLKKMKDDVEFLNPPMKVDEVIITTPAYFNESQRAATREAGRKAGLTVLSILPEPTAAAYAYGTDPDKHDGRTILVYDMGGGTFDVSIIMVSEGDFLNLGLDGDMWLGGDDMDEKIIEWIVAHIQAKYGKNARQNKSAMMEIKRIAEKAKRNLSSMEEVKINDFLRRMDNIRLDLTVTRKNYEKAIAPLVTRSMELVDKAIAKSGVPDDQIEEVLMVGGATRTPLVRETARARFGPERVQFGIDPVECVGKGAAIYAARFPADTIKCPRCSAMNTKANLSRCRNEKCGYVFSEEEKTQWFECPNPNCHTRNKVGAKVCSNCGFPFGELPPGLTAQSYGVGLVEERYAIVMPSGTSYPMKEPITRIFYTVSDNQKIVDVPVYCGEILDDVSQNDYMGNVFVALENPVPKQTPVEVSFKLDRSQILEVAVEVKDARHSHAQAVMQHKPMGKERKSIIDEIDFIRSEAGDRLTEKQQAELDAAESQVNSIIMNPEPTSSDKLAQIRKIWDNVKRIEEEVGIRKDIPVWIGQAKNVLNAVKFAHEKLGKLVDPDVAIQLPKLASNLDKAIELQDEEKCNKYIAQFEAMLRDFEKDAAKVWSTYMKVFQLHDPAKMQAYAHKIDLCVGRLEGGDYEAEKELERISLEIDEEIRQIDNVDPERDEKKKKKDGKLTDQIRNNPFTS